MQRSRQFTVVGMGILTRSLPLFILLSFLTACQTTSPLRAGQGHTSQTSIRKENSKEKITEGLFPGFKKKKKERSTAVNDSRSTKSAPAKTSTAERAPRNTSKSKPIAPELKGEAKLRYEIEAAAEGFIGRPYQYGAKGPNSFDCSGFTSYVLKEFDIALLSSSMSQAKQGRAIEPRQAQPGDIVYFANSDGRVNHVGIVVANGPGGLEIVHASSSRGIVRDNVTHSDYWAPRLAGARCVVECRVGMVAAY